MGNAESTLAIPWEDADRLSRVFLNPLILLKILKLCDLQSVLAIKATSRFGRLCAMDALRDHIAQLPWIHTDGYVQFFGNRPRTPMDTFKNKFFPESRIPVKLLVQSWSTEVSEFVHDYGEDIMEVKFLIDNCRRFTLGDDLYLLPRLERTTFVLLNGHYDLNSIQDYFDLFSRIVSASERTSCKVTIHSEGLLRHLPVILPEKMTYLEVANDNQFEALAENSNWPRLEQLKIHIRPRQGPYRSVFLDTHGGQLKQLALIYYGRADLPYTCQLPALPQLTDLSLNMVLLSQNVLLPNLQKVSLTEGVDGAVGASIVRPGNVFASVRELYYACHNMDFRPEILRDNIRGFTTSFPNLSSLTFKGYPVVMEYAGRIIFWYMVNLEELSFSATLKLDVLKVLTGNSMRDVFVDRTEWSRFFAGRPDTICNLQRLRRLRLSCGSDVRSRLGDLECEYLFSIVFTQMPGLHKLEFENLLLQNELVKTTWRNSGRELYELAAQD